MPDGTTPPASPPEHGKTLMGHPVGLFLLFLVEMWERFSYYGMRALLILYLVKPINPEPDPGLFADSITNPGRGWTRGDASTLYGWYTGLAYLLPVFGGMIADKLIGTHRSMVVGGLLIAAGHVALAVSGLGGMAHSATGMAVFIAGLALIVIGTGHFKPTVSVMVGQLYPPGDPRRDGAFSIFYMGINLGAFLCAFICGTLGERVGWHWGFGSAAVGMLAGLALYLWGKPRFLAGVGSPPPASNPNWPVVFLVVGSVAAALVGLLTYLGVFASLHAGIARFAAETPRVAFGLGVGMFLAAVAAAVVFSLRQPPGDRGPVASIFIFMFFNAFFWIAFEQAGSSINLFTDTYTDRTVLGFEIPTTWFQSVNPLLIILLAPFFGAAWTRLARRNANPPQPVKIALGLVFLGAGYVFMVWGAQIARAGVGDPATAAKASMLFILATYFLHTVGELCLSPTGLSYVTKAAPVRFVSLLMGIWFVSSFIANLGGGLVAAQVEAVEKGRIKLPWNFGGQADFFMLFVVTSVGAGLLIFVLTPALRKLMRNPKD
jgi:POT family proton-dependent oligopeptide transporter